MRGKHLSATGLYEREQRRREAEAEFRRLQERWPKVRQLMSAEAITFAWFLLGDKTWTEEVLDTKGQCDACAGLVASEELRAAMPAAGVEGSFCAKCRGDE